MIRMHEEKKETKSREKILKLSNLVLKNDHKRVYRIRILAYINERLAIEISELLNWFSKSNLQAVQLL